MFSSKLLYEVRCLLVAFWNAGTGPQEHVGDRQIAVLDLNSVCEPQAGALSQYAIYLMLETKVMGASLYVEKNKVKVKDLPKAP